MIPRLEARARHAVSYSVLVQLNYRTFEAIEGLSIINFNRKCHCDLRCCKCNDTQSEF